MPTQRKCSKRNSKNCRKNGRKSLKKNKRTFSKFGANNNDTETLTVSLDLKWAGPITKIAYRKLLSKKRNITTTEEDDLGRTEIVESIPDVLTDEEMKNKLLEENIMKKYESSRIFGDKSDEQFLMPFGFLDESMENARKEQLFKEYHEKLLAELHETYSSLGPVSAKVLTHYKNFLTIASITGVRNLQEDVSILAFPNEKENEEKPSGQRLLFQKLWCDLVHNHSTFEQVKLNSSEEENEAASLIHKPHQFVLQRKPLDEVFYVRDEENYLYKIHIASFQEARSAPPKILAMRKKIEALEGIRQVDMNV